MIKKLIRSFLHVMVIIFLTVTTQIGGMVYLITVLVVNNKKVKYRQKRVALFAIVYLVSNLILVPNLAPLFGREKIKQSELIKAHSFFTNLMNRNYVRPELNKALASIANRVSKKHKGLYLVYLDANFPFINKFPLLPHLSHNDGKKIDVSLVYKDEKGVLTNKKPSVSGYGVFEVPLKGEYNQIKTCKDSGKWQYDFTKYFTFGAINKGLVFSEKGTKDLVLAIQKEPSIGKIFIEPHIKNRLHLKSSKIRFHGCQAVRHDDHIHFQLK